jgi:post-segregation antitoxin (ccd killing protein)|tara:strand:- start:258 stop:509 length:252 start_codon:yes stop_codon:yes gene_type:complete
MASVISVSVPDELGRRWKDSGKDISPSALFQTALETELDNTNKAMAYWSDRALKAERKLKTIQGLIDANDKDVKKFLLFEEDR